MNYWVCSWEIDVINFVVDGVGSFGIFSCVLGDLFKMFLYEIL